jgi:hypothetical protein
LRHGDSLVGLSYKQIAAFHWDPDAPHFQTGFASVRVREHLAKVTALRQRIREADEKISDSQLREIWEAAQFELDEVRLFGDLVLAAMFEGDSPKVREGKRSEFASMVVNGEAERYRGWLTEMRQAERPLVPFHWEIEFPEVYERDTAGFDSIVGNPPFLGGAKVWPTLGGSYRDWLQCLHPKTSGKAVDLVAHFFRRAFSSINAGGTFGLIATNTIAQGDTREAGLRQIRLAGGCIFAATRRVRWPGQVAVVVSVVHVVKGPSLTAAVLDGKRVAGVNSFLFPRSIEFEPKPLRSNLGTSFRGCNVYGQGFVFDDTDPSGMANSIADMARLVERDPKNRQRIFPYIGGKELGTHPEQLPHRFVINFAQMSLEEAQAWPDLLELVREKVKPERDGLSGYSVADVRREYWWQYGSYTPALYKAIEGLARVLAISQVRTYPFHFKILVLCSRTK